MIKANEMVKKTHATHSNKENFGIKGSMHKTQRDHSNLSRAELRALVTELEQRKQTPLNIERMRRLTELASSPPSSDSSSRSMTLAKKGEKL
jgi:hypothetical protein